MRSSKLARVFTLAAGTMLALGAAAPAAAVSYVGSVVASGLYNPRGLAFGPDGGLYIAEGGTFNPGGPVAPTGEGPGTFGTSGAITRVTGFGSGALVQQQVVTGLPSLASVRGSATGPQDIAFYNGTGYVVVGLGANPAVRGGALGSAPQALNLGSLYSFSTTTPGGAATPIADLATYEATQNPTGDQVDSNPYHLTAGPRGLLVVDAGGDDLLNVAGDGTISTVATFPHATGAPDSVPTGVAVGPDGAYYVSQLTGGPFIPGSANIFRIAVGTDPATGAPIYGPPTSIASGLTTLTDLAWGLDGSLYALQYSLTGNLAAPIGSLDRINADGSHEQIYGGLVSATGLEIGSDGAFYVTVNSASPGNGQVLRIAAIPEPATWGMMVLGFGLAGAALRRRARGAVPAG